MSGGEIENELTSSLTNLTSSVGLMAILSSTEYRCGAFLRTRVVALAVTRLMAISLSACSLAPPYQRPAAPIPARLDGALEYVGDAADAGAAPVVLSESERRFLVSFSPNHDLVPLVEQALAHNRDFRIAALQVEQARALNRIDSAQQLPELDASAQLDRQRFSNSDLDTRYGQDVSTATVGISDFELDFFGRVRSLSEASRHRYLASVEGQRAFRGALITEVLRAYVIERAATSSAQELHALDADTQTMLSLTERQEQVGSLALDELNLQRSDAEHVRMRWLQAQADEATARNALQLITGDETPALTGTLDELADTGEPLDWLKAVPSEVLLQRPDIIQAEERLRAANADIGAARAAFFPSIRLSTSVGTASAGLAGLFERSTGVWTFVPQVTLPIFDNGRNQANLDLAHLRKDVAVAEYERVVQSAFRDVADALAARGPLIEQLRWERALTATERERVSRATARFAAGWADRPTLLAARVRLAQTNVARIEAHQALELNQLTLYRALYGVQVSVLPNTAQES
ncbi:MAG: efflux transporter outer membrane subunit [Pseudomonadota bacterium]|uniref:efflux transporter outer membrane subunit n=1 Tax=Burkholderiaceae TaxID=119060 RepID=UPI002017D2F3|nr:efflux transporter outer membrane subunit [Burkholderia sp. 4M9327F10]